MTWNPAPASTGTWCRQSRPESGKPCSSTTGRPCPVTSYSIPTPLTSTCPIWPSLSSRGNLCEKLLTAGPERRRVPPARSQLEGLVAQSRPGEDLLRRLQHEPDVESRPRAVRVPAERGVKCLVQLVPGIRGVVGGAADAGLDLAEPVPVAGEGHAVPRLDSLDGGRVERLDERRRVIEADRAQLVPERQGVQHADRCATTEGGIGARPGVGYGYHARGDRLPVHHEAPVAVLQPRHHLDSVVDRSPVQPVGDQRKGA